MRATYVNPAGRNVHESRSDQQRGQWWKFYTRFPRGRSFSNADRLVSLLSAQVWCFKQSYDNLTYGI